jgi:hypothetical protein
MLKTDSVNIGNLPIIYLDKWSDLDVTTTLGVKHQELSKITMSHYENKLFKT